MQVLDGIVDTPNRIVIMTTNHPEKLDKALIRPGNYYILNARALFSSSRIHTRKKHAHAIIQKNTHTNEQTYATQTRTNTLTHSHICIYTHVHQGRIDFQIYLGMMRAPEARDMINHYFTNEKVSEAQYERLREILGVGIYEDRFDVGTSKGKTPAQVEQKCSEFDTIDDLIDALDGNTMSASERHFNESIELMKKSKAPLPGEGEEEAAAAAAAAAKSELDGLPSASGGAGVGPASAVDAAAADPSGYGLMRSASNVSEEGGLSLSLKRSPTYAMSRQNSGAGGDSLASIGGSGSGSGPNSRTNSLQAALQDAFNEEQQASDENLHAEVRGRMLMRDKQLTLSISVQQNAAQATQQTQTSKNSSKEPTPTSAIGKPLSTNTTTAAAATPPPAAAAAVAEAAVAEVEKDTPSTSSSGGEVVGGEAAAAAAAEVVEAKKEESK